MPWAGGMNKVDQIEISLSGLTLKTYEKVSSLMLTFKFSIAQLAIFYSPASYIPSPFLESIRFQHCDNYYVIT